MPAPQRELLLLEGTVSSIIFQNEENGYTILSLDVSGEETTVVGEMPGVSPGEYLSVRGGWVRHAAYGTQFRAETVERRLPQGLKEIFHYLSSGAVKGVGKATARPLIEEFGEDALHQISDAFRSQMGMRRMVEFLTEHKLELSLTMPLYRAYGDVALEVIKANPYLLVGEEFGVEFSDADRLALELGLAGDDPQRLEAGLLYELTHNSENNGHVFLPRRKLLDATAALLDIPGGELEGRLEALERRREAVCCEIAGEQAVYLPALYEAECLVADRIGALSQSELLPPDDLDGLLRKI